MHKHPLTLLILLLLLLQPGFTAAMAGEPGDLLLRSARMWEIKNRPDLQRLALEKYLLAHPDDANALLTLGQLEIRSGRFDVVNALIANLRSTQPNSTMARDLATAYRIATRDRLQMATVNRLIQIDRYAEAVTALRKLFPDGAPGGELGIEYYRVIDSASEGWDEADHGLRRLVRENPGDPQFVLALARHLTRRAETRSQSFDLLAQLAERKDVEREKVLNIWSGGLARLPDDVSALPAMRSYLAVNAEDKEVLDQIERIERAEKERQQKLQDPGYRLMLAGITDLDAGQLAEAERKLLEARQRRPADAQVAGELGRLRLKQGRHAEAVQLFRVAAQGDKERRSKWSSLEKTASFWKLIREANVAQSSGDLRAAESKIQQALSLSPDDPNGLSALAANTLKRGRPAEAEKIYRQVLAKEPLNSTALAGLSRLLSQDGRRGQAIAMLQDLRRRYPGKTRELDAVRADLLRDQAEENLNAGNAGAALRGLEAAQLADPADPWIRYSLARLYVRLGLPRQGRVLMAEGVARAPSDPDAQYAYALLLSSLDDEAAAAQALRQIAEAQFSDGMRALAVRLQVSALRRGALNAARTGSDSIAMAKLQQAAVLAGENGELLEDIAASWTDLGRPQRGLRLMRDWTKRQEAQTPEVLMIWARTLHRTEQDGELASIIRQLRASNNLSARDRAAVNDWELSMALRQARTLTANRRFEEAISRLSLLQAHDPDNRRLMNARAEVERAAGHYASAIAIYRKMLDSKPDDLEARLALASALRQAGDVAAAEKQLDQLLQISLAEDISTRLAAARQLESLREFTRARAVLRQLREQFPENIDVLLQSGRIEQLDRQYEQAMVFFSQAVDVERGTVPVQSAAASDALPMELSLTDSLGPLSRLSKPRLKRDSAMRAISASLHFDHRLGAATDSEPVLGPLLTAAAQALTDIEQRKYGFAASGFNLFSKPGDEGVSAYAAKEIPIEIRVPYRYEGHGFVLIDPIQADAGMLPAVYDRAALFGKVQALGLTSLAAFPSGAEQSATGTSVGIGYETDDLRLDIGSTPLGFPVQDWVGGLKYDGKLSALNYTLDLSRRPVTSSLLSYAGARDPATGEIWGGVRSTGLDSRLAYYGPKYSASATAGFHFLAGRNVPGNNYLSARLTADWRVLDRINARAFAGLALTYWNYAENLSQYTFGHGGYYSPQSYTSLSLPLEWTGRWHRWAYQFRAAGSISYTVTDSALFYPGDPGLQAAAAGMPLPSGFSAPVYAGDRGSGTGYSLKAALEYELTPQWFFGGNLDIDRSAYYAPNFLSLYLRYDFDPRSGEIFFPPRQTRTYSRF